MPQPEPSKPDGLVLTLFGLPFAMSGLYILAFSSRQPVRYDNDEPASLAVTIIVGLVVLTLGAGLLYGGAKVGGWAPERRLSGWADGRVQGERVRRILGGILLLVTLPGLVAIPHELARGEYGVLGTLVFAAAGAYLLLNTRR